MIASAMAEIRRRRTPEALMGIVADVASRLGGPEKLGELMAELMDSEESDHWRSKLLLGLVKMATVAEEQIAAERATAAVEAFVRAEGAGVRSLLEANRGKVIAELRELYATGAFTLDDIDPPPSEYEWE